MKKVIVYGSPMCPHCVEAKEIFGERGIRYGYVDITAGMVPSEKSSLRCVTAARSLTRQRRSAISAFPAF